MKADNLAESGVDLIMMEMMRDTDYALFACEAALTTGLPVWVDCLPNQTSVADCKVGDVMIVVLMTLRNSLLG